MIKTTFYRNVRAPQLLDAFLVSAITSLLLLRFYLYVTGYPQLGGGPLHIAHMLYGGILMLIALVIGLSFLGVKARQAMAIIGGAGFGIFIDELGKFITEDNNYFFEPTIGLIYATFVALYLLFNFLTRKQRLSSREYQLNALTELEEAVAADLDRDERARIYSLLEAANQNSNITKNLREFVDTLEITARRRQSFLGKIGKRVDDVYKDFWDRRATESVIGAFFTAEIALLVLGVVLTLYGNIDDIKGAFEGIPTYGQELLIGQVGSAVVASGFLLYGLTLLSSSHLRAFEQFRRATLINIYLTQFFVFVRIQFDALPGLILNVILLLLITFVIRQEIRLGEGKKYVRGQ